VKILIAGAGIGGLSAALSLHAAGFGDVRLLESAREIQQVGVGINLPPHAVRELVELGLGNALAQAGLPTAELAYYDSGGQLIWAEPRGLDAGYRWPQYSIHRGKLQQLLLDAALERLGPHAVLTGHRVCGVERVANGVRVRTDDVRSGSQTTHDAALLVGADGIRSAVRATLCPDLQLATNGWTMFRGAARGAPFLSGRSMVIVGDETRRAVVYPLDGETLNWLVVRPAPSGAPPLELGNWNRPISPQLVADFVQDWVFDWLDLPALVRATESAYEYPMADLDPLPQWTFGRVTLLGDAAHAMYPFGSNGASQAILDGRVLAYHLATQPDVDGALAAYEAERRPAVSAVQLANRRQAGDVMARVSALARAQDHASAAAELKQVEQKYKQLAGFDVETLNQRPSLSVVRGRDASQA
jgi:2-polyprenyl-6-methoxyphenol hydroxylase-like FAD-dependent oxidoreductase